MSLATILRITPVTFDRTSQGGSTANQLLTDKAPIKQSKQINLLICLASQHCCGNKYEGKSLIYIHASREEHSLIALRLRVIFLNMSDR